MHDLTAQTLEFIRQNRLLSPGDRVLLSMSAGKDSMAMLHILRELSGTIGFTMGIFHLNHCMRGEESDLDETLVKETAAAMNIPVSIFSHDFMNERTPGLSFEEDARNRRYTLLANLCEAGVYGKIAVGHNRADNIETILMRIFTGTGVYGLRGMGPSRDTIIRPLLHASPENIYRFLSDQGIRWREDRSNSEDRYRRNFLRNRVIPLVTETFPMLNDAVENLSSVAADYESLLEKAVLPRVSPRREDNGGISISVDAAGSREIFTYAVSKIMREEHLCTVSSSALNEMYRKLESGRTGITLFENQDCTVRRTTVGGEKRIVIEPTIIIATADWEYPFMLSSEGPQNISVSEIGVDFTVSESTYDFFLENRSDSNYLFIAVPDSRCGFSIRNRRKGDRMQLEYGPKKLKELFIEKKLDRSVKNRIPLLIAGSEVAAIIPGAISAALNRVAPGYHVREDSKKVLALYFTKKQM